jgi:hypothetical protein
MHYNKLMDVEELIAQHPLLFHAAAADSWPSIRRHGLLSTSKLLDLFEVDGPERDALELEHRPQSVPLHHPAHGQALVRHQRPLNMTLLERSLTDMTIPEWLALINARVFFWTTHNRLKRMLAAYGALEHDVLVVDTRRLIERHRHRITLSHVSSGATRSGDAPRGSATFRPIVSYAYRGTRDAVAEIAVKDSVQDIEEVTIRVERWRGTLKLRDVGVG